MKLNYLVAFALLILSSVGLMFSLMEVSVFSGFPHLAAYSLAALLVPCICLLFLKKMGTQTMLGVAVFLMSGTVSSQIICSSDATFINAVKALKKNGDPFFLTLFFLVWALIGILGVIAMLRNGNNHDRISTNSISQSKALHEKIGIFVFNVLPLIAAVFVTVATIQLLSKFLGSDVLLPRFPDVKLIFFYGVLALSFLVVWIVILAGLILLWSRTIRSFISLDKQCAFLHNNLPERSLALRLGKALIGWGK